MTGKADDAGLGDMRLPVGIDMPRHLKHASSGLFCVETVVGHVLHVVAIGAALLRRDPLGYRRHDPIELIGAQIRQHLNVLIDVNSAVAARGGLLDRIGKGVGSPSTAPRRWAS